MVICYRIKNRRALKCSWCLVLFAVIGFIFHLDAFNGNHYPGLISKIAPLARNALIERDEAAISNGLVPSDDFPEVPDCLFIRRESISACPPIENIVSDCTVRQCTLTFIGSCMQYSDAVNVRCVCEHYNDQTCSKTCRGDVQRYDYLAWLNVTCADLSGWTGLPSNWESNVFPFEVLEVGTSEADDSWDLDQQSYTNTDPNGTYNNGTYIDRTYNYGTPLCFNRSSPTFSDCLVDGSELRYANQGGEYSDDILYLDQSCFCTHRFDDFQQPDTGCETGIERTELLTWYNATCFNASVFPNEPSDWAKNLEFVDDSYIIQSDFDLPNCLGNASCTPRLNDTEVSCTSTRCKVDSAGNCTTTLVVERSCFCQDLSFAKSCPGRCDLSWQRYDYLHWLNKSCSSVPGWSGLPSNWTSLLHVQENELLPWHWSIQAIIPPANLTNSTLSPNDQHVCPSPAAKLGAYAAVNCVMAVVVPILGRRTVINRITFGRCGNPWSRKWFLTGVISIGLQVGSNTINAFYVRSVPGFRNVPILDLILLWCTRPRLAWLVIALVPVQADEAIYFSVAASSLTAEVVLQILGSVSMGRATNYGRLQHFYHAGHLAGAPHKTSVQIMYAGSLLWLINIGFALLAAWSSAMRVDDHIMSIKRRFTGPVRLAKKRAKAMRHQVDSLNNRVERRKNFWTMKSVQFLNLGSVVSEEIDKGLTNLVAADQVLHNRWYELMLEWQYMSKHLVEDSKALRKAEKENRRLSKKPPAARDQSEESKDDIERQQAMERVQKLQTSYLEIPLAQSKQVAENLRNILSSAVASAGKDSIEASLDRVGVRREEPVELGANIAEKRYRMGALDLFAHLERNWAVLAEDEHAILKETEILAEQWKAIHKSRAAEKEPSRRKGAEPQKRSRPGLRNYGPYVRLYGRRLLA